MSIPFLLIATTLLSLAPAAADDTPTWTFPLKVAASFSLEDREATGFQKAVFCEPVLDERRIYVAGSNGILYARYRDTFESAWTFSVGAPIQLALLPVGDDRIIMAAGNSVYCLRRQDGIVLWIADAPNPLTAGVVGNAENVVVADAAGGVICLSQADGSTVWKQPGMGETTAAVRSPLFINNDIVYAGSDGGIVIALSMRDGRIIWTARAGGPIRSGFAAYKNLICFGSDDNYVYALNSATGGLEWRQRTAGDVNGMPCVVGDYLYISARDRTLRIFDAGNGHPVEQSPIGVNENFDVAPLFSGTMMFYPQKNVVVARVPEQNFIVAGSFTAAAEITTPLVVDAVRGLIYFGTRDGSVFAVTSNTQPIGPQPIADVPVATAATSPVEEPAAEDEQKNRGGRRNRDQAKADQTAKKKDSAAESAPADARKKSDGTVIPPEVKPEESKPAENKQAESTQPVKAEEQKTEPAATPEKTPQEKPAEKPAVTPEAPEQKPLAEEKKDAPIPAVETKTEVAPDSGKEVPKQLADEVKVPTSVVDDSLSLSPEAALARARILVTSGDIASAARHFRRALGGDPQARYTISLGLYCLEGSVSKLVKRYADQDVLLFSRERGEQTCYFVCVGLFNDKDAALAYLDSVADKLDKTTSPRVYRLDSFLP